MLFADRDYEGGGLTTELDYSPIFKPKITVESCEDKEQSVVTVRCKDCAKLMFDIVSTLTDMQYIVFQVTISSDGPYTTQVHASFLAASENKLGEREVRNIFRFHDDMLYIVNGSVLLVKPQKPNYSERQCT